MGQDGSMGHDGPMGHDGSWVTMVQWVMGQWVMGHVYDGSWVTKSDPWSTLIATCIRVLCYIYPSSVDNSVGIKVA